MSRVVWKHGPPSDEEWAEIEALRAAGDFFLTKLFDRTTAHWHTNPRAFAPRSSAAAYELHSHGFPVVGHSHGVFQ